MGKQLYSKRSDTSNGVRNNKNESSGKSDKILPMINTKSNSNSKSVQRLRAFVSKQQLVYELQKSLKHKLSIDQQVKQKLYEEQARKIEKQKRIQLELQQINRQNTVWISKLNEYAKLIQGKKLKLQLSRSVKEQQQLIKQYNRLLQQQEKIRLTKQYRTQIQKKNWIQIAKEKQKLSRIIQQNQKQLLRIARTKSHQVHSRVKQPKTKPLPQPKKEEQTKKLRKSKNIEELKQLGRMYLQFAKKAEKSKSQKRLLKLQNKNIDYGPQMKELIKLKVDDLSKKPQLNLDQTILSRKKRLLKNTLASTDSLNFKRNESSLNLRQSKSRTQRQNNKMKNIS